MAEGGANAEAFAAAEVPRLAAARLVVDDNGSACWAKRYGVEVEGAVEYSHADILGARIDCHRRFSVNSVCVSRWFQH